MQNPKLQAISDGFRLDYLSVLDSRGSLFEQGPFVMSAEFKATKQALVAEILVTGLVADPSHESPFQHHLLPLLNITIPLVARVMGNSRFSEYAENLSQLEVQAIEQLERLRDPLAELASASRKAGGLKSVRMNISEPGAERSGSSETDIRKLRQDRKFAIARAHVQAHFATRELPFEGEEIQVGKQIRFSVAELRFANLYSLARALGVKEISPRIFSKERKILTEEIMFQAWVDPKIEFTVLVARLKRAGVIPE